MNKIDLVAQNPSSTVVAEYTPLPRKAKDYQSEAELERAFIEQLQHQAYDYITIGSEAELLSNLRTQLEKLNDFKFSDTEWENFFATHLANANEGIEEKTATIQEDNVKNLSRDDGSVKNIKLIDKENIHNNSLQVINQYEVSGTHDNRYDVTILVNGLPLVHVELKRRGVDIKEAFNQINRYQRESFWAGNRLFEYVQLFVISNGTYTKYYSNTTRWQHIKEANQQKTKGKKTSNSYEFTSWWADANNRPITELTDFAATFLAKHSLLNILTKYCVFTSDRLLLAMRPYQIVATERILNRIQISTNYKKLGTIEAGGYIWHTTGSGKTLTSFKTAQLASKLDYVDKVLFVVDRKDLDYQTMKEYDKFEKGAANSNTSTAKLTKQLEDPNAKIIITTIQKLDKFIKKNEGHKVLSEHTVLIFDECHRSQFGDMHHAVTGSFKNYHIFGFTGTPIFAKNSSGGGRPDFRTTEQAFGEKLHTYTIVDAITDKNVLPFRIDYIRTIREADDVNDSQVRDIDREKALNAPERISNVTSYIREHFDQKTKRNSKPYAFTRLANVHEAASARDRNAIEEVKEKIRLSGFNSIFAVSSIEVAKLYYNEFKKQQAETPELARLKVATIFSYSANEVDDELDGIEDENSEGTEGLDASSREFLENAIADYNKMFKTNYDTSSDKFQSYYKDVSLRMKNREIDLLIVVNMFLTGFDATTLNTLWVDKNLRMHGLLQAYSRTNRILNSIKTFGNIITFRNLEKATNDALALFGDKEASGIVLLKTYREYYEGYENDGKSVRGYAEMVAELQEKFPVGQQIIGEQNQKDFIRLYGGILKIRNILSTFDEFDGNEILTERDVQDYHSIYINLYNDFRKTNDGDKENINDDVVFEMELIKQVEINIDYILELIRRFHAGNQEDKEILVDINKAIDSSIELRNKKELIEQFISSLDVSTDIDSDWQTFVDKKKLEELDRIISDEGLNPEETYKFIESAFRDGGVQTTGTAITKILPPVSRFSADNTRGKKRETVLDKLSSFFNKFFDISSSRLRE
ncbi:type I restriction endonuclease subunit R [Candidatus Saccharibacteria bacterium]|nr:type I restriction endonuclease subunit R [Candidatus Saccharibacteria bacterium]